MQLLYLRFVLIRKSALHPAGPHARLRSGLFAALIGLMCLTVTGWTQDTNEVAILKEQIRQLKEQQEDEIRRLEERINDLENARPDNMRASDTDIKVLNDLNKAREKGDIDTYHDKTAMEAYQDTLPESTLKLQDNTASRLFDYLTKGFEWHGYFRAGYGINSKGGHMEAFQAPGAPVKYRLGNEQETYIETTFLEKNWNPNTNSLDIKTQIRVAYKTQQNKSWDEENRVVLREMFAAMGNFIESNPSAKVWAGERFYRLPELNINDFWWYDMSGYGGGFEDVDLGAGRMHIAYIGYSEDASSYWTSSDKNVYNYTTANGRLAKNNLNVMFSDFYTDMGKLTSWVNGGFMNGGTTTNSDGASYHYPSQAGIDCGVMHQVKAGKADNQFALQYGYGCNSSLSAGGNQPANDDNTRANIFRATEMYDQQVTERFSAEAVGVLQYMNNGADSKSDATWASAGVRPIYQFFKHFGIEFEPGIDYINDRQNNFDSYLLKITGALRITPDPGFNSRPEFRLFCTYAQWGNDFEGNPAMGGTAFLNQRDGLNFGVQAEHWW